MTGILEKFTYGIYVLGSKNGTGINTMVASWVTQLSGEPRLMGVAVKKDRQTHELVRRGGVFTLAVLGREQRSVMERFKGSKEITDKTINGVPYKLAENGAPVPADCIGYAELALEREIDLGDHTLFVGRVTKEALIDESREPLLSCDPNCHAYAGV